MPRTHSSSLLFFVVLLLVLSSQFLLQYDPKSNEVDVLAQARQFVQRDWIPNDWYLNQSIGYRNLFNLYAGGLLRLFPGRSGVYIGRLIQYLLFSWALMRLFGILKPPLGFVLLGLFVFVNHQSIMAGEWMVGGLEAKSFAWSFSLLSLSFFLEHRYSLFWLFSGLAVSSHVLVGGYGIVAMVLLLAVEMVRKEITLAEITRGIYFLPLFGFMGVIAVAGYLSDSVTVDTATASEIYAGWRVAHHTLAVYRDGAISATKVLRGLGAFILAVILPVLTRRSNSDDDLHRLAHLTAIVALFLVPAYIVALTRNYTLAKYYLFRYPDSFLLVSFIFIASKLASNTLSRAPKAAVWLNRSVVILVVVLSLVTFHVPQVAPPSPMNDAIEWLQESTPREAVFLVPPNRTSSFYVRAERALFVSLKHSPQNDTEILEWYHRLTLCNGNIAPDLSEPYTSFGRRVEDRCNHLPSDQLAELAGEYGIDYYLTTIERDDLPYEKVFQEGDISIYHITNGAP